mmetsp:Transcript_160554/g.295924  ORF Transcript_160554/g.295924 Transcript_160554/m.295924 type:complete len:243 (+) Transcript_160554:373-1101(+)
MISPTVAGSGFPASFSQSNTHSGGGAALCASNTRLWSSMTFTLSSSSQMAPSQGSGMYSGRHFSADSKRRSACSSSSNQEGIHGSGVPQGCGICSNILFVQPSAHGGGLKIILWPGKIFPTSGIHSPTVVGTSASGFPASLSQSVTQEGQGAAACAAKTRSCSSQIFARSSSSVAGPIQGSGMYSGLHFTASSVRRSLCSSSSSQDGTQGSLTGPGMRSNARLFKPGAQNGGSKSDAMFGAP